MGKIKGWSKNKIISKSSGSDVWYNDNYYAYKITNGRKYFYPSIVINRNWNNDYDKKIWEVTRIESPYRNTKELNSFITKKEAINYAIKYMKTHPRG